MVDPRSGEVISSHTLLWHDVLKLLETWYFTQASPLDPRAQKLPLQPELMGELLRYVLRHEIGHALGLRHNFKATSAVGVKELRDPQWTKLWGTSASTMSYARFNYVAQPGDGAGLVPKFGPYDYFAIEWGYKVFAEDMTPDEELELLDEIAARQVSNPLLRFGGEDEAAEVDPTVYSNVLGSDAIAAGDLGLRNIDRVMSFIVPATTRTGEGYDKLSTMYEALVQQRHRELVYVSRLVGGVEETRYQAGRGSAPFDPVAPGAPAAGGQVPGRARLHRAQAPARSGRAESDHAHGRHRSAAGFQRGPAAPPDRPGCVQAHDGREQPGQGPLHRARAAVRPQQRACSASCRRRRR